MTMMRLRGFRLLRFVTAVITTAQLCISLAPSITQPLNSKHSSLKQFSFCRNRWRPLRLNSAADEVTNVPVDHIPGSRGEGYIVTKTYDIPLEGFPLLSNSFDPSDQERLQLDSLNVTLPAALMLLDPEKYPTQSRARKVIRQRAICLCRNSNSKFDELGKVIARVYPGDRIGYQQRVGNDYYSVQGTPYRLPAFDVPVIFEDDHMAIVNKPAGIVSYKNSDDNQGGGSRGGHGRDTLLSALPAVLKPSNIPTSDDNYPMKRPQPVHRLDRPTSGLVVVAKTRAATVHLSQQFEFRKAQKTYMAILNGSPQQTSEATEDGWNLIDHDLEEKSAITQWKVLQTVKSLHGNNGVLTLVELRPKTGRYHQLRRHMAWVCRAPIVGDATYDEDNLRLRKRGLFLCSNEIRIEHPYYNTASGREEWRQMKKDRLNLDEGCHLEEDEETGIVTLRVRIDLPKKFASFLRHEGARANKFLNKTG
ncbi:hypothetical protein ACHAWT_006826 [Skeletonema menzelii]